MKKFFFFDCHVGVYQEIRWIVQSLFPQGVELHGWLISEHGHYINKKKDHVEHVNSETWFDLTLDRIKAFHQEYDEYLKQFDIFIVGHPNTFSLLFEKYGKPIIALNTCRSDMPYCWTKNWDMLSHYNETLKKLNALGKLAIVSNNLADLEYTALAPHEIRPIFIPTSGAYAEMHHKRTNNQSLLFGKFNFSQNFDGLIVEKRNLGIVSNEQLSQFSSYIHIPYEVSTMSLFEQYASCFPLIVPSYRFLKELLISDIKSWQSRYWFHNGDTRFPTYLKSALDSNSLDWWISRSDFYTHLSSLNFFDSESDLNELIKFENQGDLKYASEVELSSRNHSIIQRWTSVFNDLL